MPRPHTGVPLGNGTQGLLIWGQESLLLTVACAGFWDRRNGTDIPAHTTFAAVRLALENKDDTALAALFPTRNKSAAFPQQYGGGRLEIRLPEGLRPIRATLNLESAVINVEVGRDANDPATRHLLIRQAAANDVCWIEGDDDLLADLDLQPAFHLVKDGAMAALEIEPPEEWKDHSGGGFVQSLPADEPLSVAWLRKEKRILLVTALGWEARSVARNRLRDFHAEAEESDRLAYWIGYWSGAARVNLPDPVLQRQFDYGLYRQAGLIRSHAPAATLQGPWMEDTRIPPWSNDYHFNINVQLVYGAALATGQAAEMRPLWDMLRAWIPRFRDLGEGFYGTAGAMLLPHAVDDRCQMMGSFWSGAIDQACIAWMARMACDYYHHTGDLDLLREIAWPLLEGAFAGYHSMLETTTGSDRHKRYSLPVSVSPEFGGSARQLCWGRDASFQLAALHSTLRLLQSTASILGHPADPRWADVAADLPAYTLATVPSLHPNREPVQRIALWEGMDLPESHRHHSHLAAIFPFCTIDPFGHPHRKIVSNSIRHWVTTGAGNWTGWCLPWASILCSRCGLQDAAVSWLHLLAEAFTNEGHATLHNADGAGMFALDDGSLATPDHRKSEGFLHEEMMQMDAAMGAIHAILELLISVREGVIHITDRLPKGWRDLSFARIRTHGGFEIDGRFCHGRAEEITVHSLRGCELHICHSLGASFSMNGESCNGSELAIPTQIGQTIHLRRTSKV